MVGSAGKVCRMKQITNVHFNIDDMNYKYLAIVNRYTNVPYLSCYNNKANIELTKAIYVRDNFSKDYKVIKTNRLDCDPEKVRRTIVMVNSIICVKNFTNKEFSEWLKEFCG